MKPLPFIALVVSVLINIITTVFIVVLVATPLFNIPLAAYSHYKNCEKEFDKVLEQTDSLPAEHRDQAKQLFGQIVCQKDYKTGQPLTEQDFGTLLNQLESQPQ